jgi:ferritin-like metal-binding protein YciE
MADLNARDAKLIQYLNEAYGKEKELETALQAHIAMTTRAPYKKRLQQHLRETKNHARLVERRIKKLGGGPQRLQEITGRALATAKGPLHAIRGTSEEEKLLKNAKTEYSEEAEEIATYTAIEALADSVGDRETAKVARQIRREEERMSSFLATQIPILTRAVATKEIPAAERNGGTSRRRSTRRRSTSSKSSGGRSGTRASKRSASSRAGSKRTTARSSSSRSTSARSSSSRARASSSTSRSRSSGGSRRSSGRSRTSRRSS